MATIIAATALTAGGAAALTHTMASAHARHLPRIHVVAAAAPVSSTSAPGSPVLAGGRIPIRVTPGTSTRTPVSAPAPIGSGSSSAGAGAPARASDVTSVQPTVSRLRPDNNALEPMPDPVLPTGPATNPATGTGSPTGTATAPGSGTGTLSTPASGEGTAGSTTGTGTGTSTGTSTGGTQASTGGGTMNSGNATGTGAATGPTSGSQSGSGLTGLGTSTANETPARYGPRTV